MKSFLKFILFVLVLSMALAGLYNLVRDRRPGDGPSPGAKNAGAYTPADKPHLDPGTLGTLEVLDREYTALAESVVPSVVSITTSRTVRMQVLDPFEMFFGRRSGRLAEQKQNSLGSGAIVSKEGHILTNNHVIDSMDEITVLLSDGRSFPAKLIGTDPETDIAVLKINADGLRALPLGDSDSVKVGQLVFAVGNPFGLEESVTQGIISAIGRRTMSDSANEYLQTDTAINPGNSGGPLVNLRGEIVGVNNHIFSQSGGYQGIGFAIPSNVARRVMEGVISQGRVVKGYLGIIMQPLTADMAAHFGLKDTSGALVADIVSGSPAEQAGLPVGDVIRELNGKKIKDIADVRRRVQQIPVGEEVRLEIIRKGKELTLGTMISEMPAGPLTANPGVPRMPGTPAPAADTNNPLTGISVRDLTPEIVAQENLPANIRGVQVVQIDPRSPAAQVLRPGDVIEEIERQAVPNIAAFRDVVAKLDPSRRIMLFLCRKGARSFVMINP